MGNVISGSIVTTLFLMVTMVVFFFLISSFTNRSLDASAASARQGSRVHSAIQINSTAQANAGVCDVYTVVVENKGEILMGDFSEMDLIVEYTDTGDAAVIERLTYATDRSVSSISPISETRRNGTQERLQRSLLPCHQQRRTALLDW